jgi:hypothetical protein
MLKDLHVSLQHYTYDLIIVRMDESRLIVLFLIFQDWVSANINDNIHRDVT